MAKKTIDNKLKKIIVKYKNAIETDGVPIEKIIVFGSYAKGFAKKNSDIDVAVVSKKFGKDDVDEIQFLYKKTWDVDPRIEPYPISPYDLETGFTPIINEIKKYGIQVI